MMLEMDLIWNFDVYSVMEETIFNVLDLHLPKTK